MVFRKSVVEKKISKFLGHLPSEQIFYRNIPLGAPLISQLLKLYNCHDQSCLHNLRISNL